MTLTLPGSIPNIRRLGSPVYSPRDDLRGVVVEASTGLRVHSPTEGDGYLHDIEDDWDLDLTDPTGRAHAAWWLWRQDLDTVELAIATVLGPNTDYAGWLDEVSSGADDSDDDIAALRLVCLHVAGRSP